jgi:hypothetical protein
MLGLKRESPAAEVTPHEAHFILNVQNKTVADYENKNYFTDFYCITYCL